MRANEEIDRLDERVKTLRIEYERFFNGALDVPPEELREEIRQQLRQLRNLRLTASVDNFRLGQLETRFNTYSELFNRRMRDHETGGRRRPARAGVPALDLERGVLVGAEPAPQVVEALYAALARGSKTPRFDLASFGAYLGKQAAAIRRKTGCEQVRFRLVDEKGRRKLKAKPIRDR